MAISIEPASVTVAARDTQVFAARQNGLPVQAEWTVVGQGTVGTNSGVYQAPGFTFISKKAAVVAKVGAEESAAVVLVSAAHTWIPILAIYLGVAAALLLKGLYDIWCSKELLASCSDNLCWIAFLAGGLGACLHGINSLVAYVGNRQFASSWAAFYLFRPVAGGILAIVVCWVYRGGLNAGKPVAGSEIYYTAAIAGLVGLFSDVAMKKLEDLVGALFSSSPDQRADKLKPAQPSKPVIKGTNPESLAATGQAQTLEIVGTGLVAGSIVKVNGSPRVITSEAPPAKLTIQLDAADVQAAGQLKVVVETPQGSSNEVVVEVVP